MAVHLVRVGVRVRVSVRVRVGVGFRVRVRVRVNPNLISHSSPLGARSQSGSRYRSNLAPCGAPGSGSGSG